MTPDATLWAKQVAHQLDQCLFHGREGEGLVDCEHCMTLIANALTATAQRVREECLQIIDKEKRRWEYESLAAQEACINIAAALRA